MTVFGFELALPALTLGAITGMTYGILAVGLVLIYRSNRIVNFAHGEVGAFGASFLGLVVVRWGVPYWIAFVGAIAISSGLGALAEVAVVRRLRKAPSLMSVIATLGVAQVVVLLSFALNGQAGASNLFPQPAGLPSFSIGALRVTPAYFGMLVLTPVVVLALVVFLRRSRVGLAVRAAAFNPDAARTSGVFAARMSTLAWAIAGAVSAFTAILVFPTRGFLNAGSFGPGLLLRALVAAVVARMSNMPVALAAGIGVGVVEQALIWNYPQGGLVEALLFAVMLVALLLQPREGGRGEDKGSWTAVVTWPALSDAARKVWLLRNLGRVGGAVAVLVALLAAALTSNSATIFLIAIIGYGIVGLSVGIVTGLAGQLSLGQFALAGIGATASFHVVRTTGNFPLAVLVAGLAAAGVSILIGLPALRIHGLMLAVTSLSFALASSAWLFQQPWMLGDGVDPGRPIFADYWLDTAKRYYVYCLVVLVLAVWFTRNVWQSGLGRRLRAVRDNEDAARAFTVPAVAVRLQGFALGGFLAGVGGSVFGHALSQISAHSFSVDESIDVVAMAVLGGLGIIAGPLIGAFYIIGVPRFVPLDSAALAAGAFGWLVLILYFPGGIAQVLLPVRERILALVTRRAGPTSEEAPAAAPREEPGGFAVRLGERERARGPEPGTTLLRAEGLAKRFGGVAAVDGVSFEVRTGETLGLIGPNGAGKTTLFELLAGFTRPDSGRVAFLGRDISGAGPEARARLGLIRSFQDASLFPTLTVQETVALSLERFAPSRFLPSVVGLRAAERRRRERARDFVHLMGLDAYRDKRIIELSTGTRRIVELTCVIALEPTLLLLDEPSSGVAQRETELLGGLLVNVKSHLSATLVIIEHDMPLVMGMSDRIIAMESGRLIAEGTPDEVRSDPLVVSSYLGGDIRAIERSGAADDGRCRGTTRAGTRCSRRSVDDGYCAQHAVAGAAR